MSITPSDRRLIVSIAEQEMALIEGAAIVKRYRISTSKRPPSCVVDSFGTPTGLHACADRIGQGEPVGMVFKGRVGTGMHFRDYPKDERMKNLITSRIIRLRGLEPGKNFGHGCDSYERYIYIHGTNHEGRIGQPFSGGCVEMRNADVIELFECVETDDLVYIC